MGTATDYDIASVRREMSYLEQRLQRSIDSVTTAQQRDSSKLFSLRGTVDIIIMVGAYALAMTAMFLFLILRWISAQPPGSGGG
jgi:hypothetical protein